MKLFTSRLTKVFFNGLYSLALLVVLSLSGFSQGVVLNTTGNPPNASAGLDLDFTNKGLLIPRVALTGTANAAPLAAHVAGMMVYNTATVGDVTPGFYYDNGNKWVPSIPAGNTSGDMLFWNGSAWGLIPAGAIGQLLQSNGAGSPTWVTGGSALPMPVLTTTAASAITGISATSGGSITGDGGLPILARGICWATSPFPTIAGTKTTDGSGTGVFSSSMTGLTPVTTYYVRAYATNSSVTAYGNQVIFTTLAVLPTLAATTTVTAITGSSATSGGNVTNNGGASITERGICYGTTSNPTTANTKIIDPSPGVGVFTSNLAGLLSTTTYYIRSYAINSAGTGYGTQVSFRTLPALTTTPATAITGGTATTGGVLTAAGGTSGVWYYGVAYSTTSNAVTPTYVQTGTFPASSPVNYVTNLTGLASSTLYYIRAYAQGSGYTTFGPELSFTTTGATAPVVASTAAITGISATTAISGGAITNDGGSPITAKGVCWSTSTNPVLGAGNFTANGTGLSAFVSNITGLTGGTTYYVRAYATNLIGTSYGPADVIFTTWIQAPYTVGQVLAYGVCGYVDQNGGGFIVSPDIYPTSPATTFTWGCNGTHVPVGTALGTGLANTDLIIATCGANTAAGSAKAFTGGGYKDWYLPSSGEWGAFAGVYYYFGLQGNTSYFTSSEYGTNYSSASSYFSTGSQAYGSGSPRLGDAFTTVIRAIRSFTNVEVTTDQVTNITGTTATSGGVVISNGGPAVTARGVCWSTSPSPTLTDPHSSDGSGTGVFVSSITGLTTGLTYYVRSYATTSGTIYGDEVSFVATPAPPASLTTSPVITVSATDVTTGGTIISDGGSTVVACGVCWDTSPNPTVALSTKTDDILALSFGSFPSSITGLTPATYYIRAYITTGAGTTYGNEISIVAGSVVVPAITTDPIINLIGAIAEGGGTIQSDGGDLTGISAFGVCWSTSPNPTIADPNTNDGSGILPFPYFSTLTGLSIGTTYHVRAYATNSAGTGYGSDITFTATAATIGQVISGGWLPSGNIFYTDGTGLHGLVALTFSNSPADWGCTNSTTGATGTAVFTGFANTAAIIADINLNSCVSADAYGAFAAPLCQFPGVNLYLPSKDEMNWLWTNQDAAGLGVYITPAGTSYPFWSSSEVDATHAWYLDTTLPTPTWVNTGLKTDQYNAWPIWSF